MGTKKAASQRSPWTAVFGLSLLAIAQILSLSSYNPLDPSLNTMSSSWKAPTNVLGYVGSWASDLLYQSFGYAAWALPLLMIVAVIRWIAQADKDAAILGSRGWVATLIALTSISLMIALSGWSGAYAESFPQQGLLGSALSAILIPFVGRAGAYLLSLTLVWCFCLVWWQDLPEYFVRIIARGARWCGILGKQMGKTLWSGLVPSNKKIFRKSAEPTMATTNNQPAIASGSGTEEEQDERDDIEIAAISVDQASGSAPIIRSQTQQSTNDPNAASKKTKPKALTDESGEHGPRNWSLPPIALLEPAKKKVKGPSEQQLLDTAKKISSALKSFDVEGSVTEISPGPIITMYEFQPGPGVRVQKIVSVATDLAMTLGAPSVRIMAPIPGKSVAGIEVPNVDKEDVVLRDVFEQTLERAKSMRLPLTLGKDAEGKPVLEDLSRMPHLLIGGATSMGKSVLVNSLLTGLLCRYTPEDLRLIIVDPKLVEFKMFEDIPHLLLPIVNDPQDASQALKWAVAETKRRYGLMQKHSVKNIDGYNAKVREIEATPEKFLKDGEETPKKIPFIVIIIDELAELMLTGRKDVEQSIVRLTQLARAAGIHLIMATQRPSADVVTGLIKSNCPSRAALRVASSSDSRIILDCTGAEQLLGRGDMFFTNTGPMGLKRMQSCYVSDEEIEKICDFWRSQGEPSYKEEILSSQEEDQAFLDDSTEGRDELWEDVLDFAKEKGKISTSLVQRRFQIGYTRAARIMEQLEKAGIVGEQSSAGKPRDVLI